MRAPWPCCDLLWESNDLVTEVGKMRSLPCPKPGDPGATPIPWDMLTDLGAMET